MEVDPAFPASLGYGSPEEGPAHGHAQRRLNGNA